MNTIWFPDLSASDGPKYKTLTSSIRDAVAMRHLKKGERLPPVRDLAWELKITPGTVARAYRKLVEDGVLQAAVGRGTFVADRTSAHVFESDPLINALQESTVDFRGCRVSDVGQGEIVKEALIRVASRAGNRYVDYPTAATDRAARAAVCHWIGPDHVGRIEPDDVVLGLGAQNCSILALQSILRGAHPVIMTEQLTYPGVRRAAQLLRAEIVGLKMDSHGICPDSFEEAARMHGGKVLLTSAEVHSPTTINTPLERKLELADIARRHDIQIIEDDCHRIDTPKALSYRAIAPDLAWYIGSLTKSVAASLRFGFIVPPTGAAPLTLQVAQSSFYGLPQPILDVCEELILSGAASEVRKKVVQSCQERVHQTVNVLGQWDIRWRPDAPFIWLKMPRGWRGSSFAVACKSRGIRVKPADEFALPDGDSPNAVRLAVNATGNDEARLAALGQINQILQHPEQDAEI
ncbi:PLP-dependent aminotransferase family protein [Falsihalocynthiibacter arcticus]|uniref:GntR family transcriptional regulator n=1 Tax=Falsihalocynthiibacter arcticus TaxID=1579316 RepID=A0A126V3K0_9RHOB|nr:PLP-dependent aminotransferase family protein [Falsihalocynthiibacter arcticus]AML52727.1 GntR family transcriptional regulator [Falsihalocynthiibacter arcticus]